jgi:hypothetical protein
MVAVVVKEWIGRGGRERRMWFLSSEDLREHIRLLP